MKLHDFNKAITPQLKRKVDDWYRVHITFSCAALLRKRFFDIMLKLHPTKTLEYQLVLQQFPEDKKSQDRDMAETILLAFFVHTERFHTFEKNSLLTLRIAAYECRMKSFLAQLHTVLMDTEEMEKPLVKSKSKQTFYREVNGQAMSF